MAYHPGMPQKYYITSLIMSRFFFLTINLLNLNLLLLLRYIKTHTRSNTSYTLGENLVWNSYTQVATVIPLPPLTCSVTLRMSLELPGVICKMHSHTSFTHLYFKDKVI